MPIETDPTSTMLNLRGLRRQLKETALRNNHAMAIISLRDYHAKRIFLTADELDAYVYQFCSRLKAMIGDHGVAARYSDSRFVILLREDDNCTLLKSIVKKSFGDLFIDKEGRQHSYNGNICYLVVPTTNDTLNANISICSLGMEQAIRQGINSIYRISDDDVEKERKRNRVNDLLHCAIERNELFLVYQPIVNVNNGGRVGAECFVRWNNPELGSVPPDIFIAEAEKTDLINKIGDWILRTAIADAAQQFAQQVWHEDFLLHINIAPQQLEKEDFADDLIRVCQQHNIAGKNIALELTERTFLKERKEVSQNIQKILRWGFGFSLDDFGSGYSTFTMLNKVDFSSIKIDRSLIQTLEEKKETCMIVSSIVRMAQSLNKYIIAEGVENRSTADILQKIQCKYAQGYLYGRPMSLSSWS